MSSRKIWLTILPLLFLLATFEHCYSILSLYSSGLMLPFVTTTLLVLAIDSSIYFSMQHIQLLPAKIILSLAATISITLNVKYMIDWKPPGIFALIIGITVGFLIPSMLGLFGWLEKEIRESVPAANSNGHLMEVVKFHIESAGNVQQGNCGTDRLFAHYCAQAQEWKRKVKKRRESLLFFYHLLNGHFYQFINGRLCANLFFVQSPHFFFA